MLWTCSHMLSLIALAVSFVQINLILFFGVYPLSFLLLSVLFLHCIVFCVLRYVYFHVFLYVY